MNRYSIFKQLFAGILCLSITSLSAQESTSPYSMFGLGNINNSGDPNTEAMGGAGIASPSESTVNYLNPASLTGLDSLTFYINLNLVNSYTHYQSRKEASNIYNSNFDRLSFGFKAARWWGISFGLRSFSNIGYSISAEKEIYGSTGTYNVIYAGTGGLSDFFVSHGFRLTKNFSLGVKTSLLWGNLTRSETSDFSNISGNSITSTNTYHLNNIYLEYGLQYNGYMNENRIMAGVTYSDKTSLYTSNNHTISTLAGYDLVSENISSSDFIIPRKLGTGLGFQFKNKLLLAADYRFEQWSQANISMTGATVNDSRIYNFGIEYSPQKNMYQNIFKRMKYRGGFSIEDSYLEVHKYNIVKTGVSLGVQIPMKQKNNSFSISYQYSQLGTDKGSLIKEVHNTVKVGFTLGERWFFKHQFE